MRIQGVIAPQVFLALETVDMGVPVRAPELTSHVLNHGLMVRKRGGAVWALGRRGGRILHLGVVPSLSHLLPEPWNRDGEQC